MALIGGIVLPAVGGKGQRLLVPVVGEILTGRKGRSTMLLLIIILLLVFGGGGGYYGHTRWGPGGGVGVGLGTILLIVLIVYLVGGLR